MKPYLKEVNTMKSYPQLWEMIAENVEEDIITGLHQAGDRLKENQLASRHGVSTTTVRAVLRCLERIGFIEIIPRSGAVVRSFGLEDIKNLTNIQVVLEELAIREAVPFLKVEHLKHMEKLLGDIEKAHQENDQMLYEKSNYDFHGTLKRAGQNRDLNTMLEEINLRVKRFRFLTRQYVAQVKDVVTPHREILKAAQKKDIGLAAELTRKHYELFQKGIIALYTSGMSTNDVVDSKPI